MLQNMGNQLCNLSPGACLMRQATCDVNRTYASGRFGGSQTLQRFPFLSLVNTTYASGRFGGSQTLQRFPFLSVVGGFAAHDRKKTSVCGEDCTFPTALCVS